MLIIKEYYYNYIVDLKKKDLANSGSKNETISMSLVDLFLFCFMSLVDRLKT